MKRSILLGFAAVLLPIHVAHAAEAPPPVAAEQIAPGLYLVTGGGGANSSILVGPDGALVVDSKLDLASAEAELAVLDGLHDGELRYLINTHVHPDHTGGNEAYGKAGATIIARDETRAILAAGQRGGPPAPPAALPTLTFPNGQLTLVINGETVVIREVTPAHTTDNSIVHFVNANVFHMGDVFQATRYPVAAGGTYQGFIDVADTVLALANEQSKFIPGNGPLEDISALRAFREMLVDVRGKVAALVKEGKSAEEIAASKPTAAYDATYGDPSRLIPGLVQELSAAGQ
ncbi:MAG: MBL fold metallo-hydrolase [Gammaproteobacteria bacterium]